MRNWINLCESYSAHPFEEFYHGSRTALDIGTRLEPRGTGCDAEIEAILEKQRPDGCFVRTACVYMVNDIRALDTVVAYYDHLYLVEPEGEIQRYDAVWINRIFSWLAQMENGQGVTKDELNSYVEGYWSGKPCPRMSGEEVAFEFLCKAATVVDEIEE